MFYKNIDKYIIFCTFIFSGLTKTQWSIIIMYWKPPPPQENKIPVVENKENPTKNNLKKNNWKLILVTVIISDTNIC